jgi:O-antigen/teichoic acid export membrane protein
VIHDVALSLATRAVTIAAGVITSILTARVLGVAGRGEYFYIITLASMVVQFGHLGLVSSNTYRLAKDHTLLPRLAANSMWVSCIAGTCTAFVVLLLVAGWNVTKWGESHAWLLLVMGPAMLYSLLASNLLIGLARIRQYNIFQIVSACFQLTVSSMAAWMSWAVAGFLTASTLTAAAAALALIWFLARLHSFRWRFDRELFGSQLGYAGRAYVVMLLAYGVSRVGVLFLSHYAGKSEIGIYSVAVQFVDVLVVLPSTTAMVLFPNLVKSDIEGQYAHALAVTWKTGLLMLALCLSIGVATYWLVPMLFGDAFAPAVYVLWWMLPGVLVLSITTIISQYLAAQGMPWGYVLAWIAGLLFLVVSCQQLVPQWGAKGAAMGLSLTYILLGCILFAFAHMHHRKAMNASVFDIGQQVWTPS